MKTRFAWGCAFALVLLLACFVLNRYSGESDRRVGGKTVAGRALPPAPTAASPAVEAPAAGLGSVSSPAGSVTKASRSDGASQVVSKRLPKARVLDERLETLADGRERWVQWLKDEGAYPQVRADLVFAPVDGGFRLVEETYYLADSVLVERTSDVTPAVFEQRVARQGLRAGPQYPFSPAVRVFLPEPLHMDAVPDALQRLGEAEPTWQVRPDHLSFIDAVSNDFNKRELWGLSRMNAPAAWEISTGSNDLVVGIIDSGTTRLHPDLAANIWQNTLESANGIDDDGNGVVDDVYGWDFAGHDSDASDQDGHGTHVAGIIGAVGNNAIGVTGVSWRVKLLSLRTGDQSLSTTAVIQAMDYLTTLKRRGVPIVAVNNSYTSTSLNTLQRDSIQRARDADILFVAAAGNNGRNLEQTGMLYPVGYVMTTVIGVAATNLGDGLADYSNYGPTLVHVAAPGSGIMSTLPGGAYGLKDGTSMAAPYVTGAAVLLRAAEPTLGAIQLKNRLIGAAQPSGSLAGLIVSGGRLDLQRLVNPNASLPQLTGGLPSASFIVLENTAQALILEVQGSRVSNGIIQDTLPVFWTKSSGPGTVTFTPLTSTRFSATFSQNGLYRLTATASYGGVSTTLEKTVAVGTSGVSAVGLIGRWTFGEESGPALDSSGSGRDGALLDGPTRDAGPYSFPGMRFIGPLSAIRFSAPAPAQVTLTGWIHMDTNSLFPRILHFPAYYLFAGRDSVMDANRGSVKFLAHWSSQDGVWHSPPGLTSLDTWHHFAATYDSTQGARGIPRLYLDGQEVEVAAQAGAIGAISLTPGDGYLGNNEERTRGLNGRLADVRIYNRQLAPEEVAMLSYEASAQSLQGWEAYVSAATSSSAVVGIRRSDGRLPGPGVSATWHQVTGPGTPAISSTTATTATISVTQSGLHTLVVDVSEGTVMLRRQASLTLPGEVAPPVPPGFVRSPGDRTVATGTTVIFESEATGSPPLTYQWMRDGVVINGQILSQLILPNVKVADGGRYSVRVTNSGGMAVSQEAVLTVLDPPAIVQQPAGKVVAAGSRVEFSVTATGSAPLLYQWSRAGVAIPGATSSTLVLENITVSQNGAYTVVVTNAVGAITSQQAILEVLQPPVIVSQPASQTVLGGSTVVLDVQVGGTVPYTFAWFKDGQLLPGQNLPTLRFTIVRLEDTGTYTFRVTNAVGTVTTTPIVLTVVSAPAITRQPQTQAVAAGRSATLSVEVSGTAPLVYQWLRYSAPLLGENSSQLVIPSFSAQHIGTYAVEISNAYGTVRSSSVFLELVPLPRITQHPASTTVALNGSAALEVSSSDPAGTIFYRWWHNGALIPDSNKARLSFSGVGLDQAGVYIAELINSGGTVFSKPAVLGVSAPGKTAGSVATRPEWQNIVHPNGNSYDQFLLDGPTGAISADAGQISRISFVDPQGEIVQAELSGKGTLAVSLADASGPAAADLYTQSGILYMKGQATLVLAGADENTHVSVYAVGTANNPSVTRPDAIYEGWATVRALGIHSGNGRIGGIRLGNARFEATTGVTGLWAQNVRVETLCYLSDIAAFASAVPVLSVSPDSEVGVTGGSLLQPNSRAIMIDGVSGVRIRAGTSSTGKTVGPQLILGRFERNGVDVTNTVVLPSS